MEFAFPAPLAPIQPPLGHPHVLHAHVDMHTMEHTVIPVMQEIFQMGEVV